MEILLYKNNALFTNIMELYINSTTTQSENVQC